MKKLTLAFILLFSCCFFTDNISAQNEDGNSFNTQKTEFNIGITNVFSKNNWYSLYYIDNNGNIIYYPYDSWISQPLPKLTIGLKIHNRKGALRLGTSLHYTNRKITEEDNYPDINRYRALQSEIYIGHEWYSNFRRVTIFYGFDVTAAYNNIYSKEENNDQSYPAYNEYKYNGLVIGTDPLLGVNFYLTEHISIGTEVKLMLEYYTGKSTSKSKYYSINDISEDSSKYREFKVSFGPLGFLSVNIHF